MLNAIFKAFTGRAGLFASLLALLILTLIAAAAILGLPKIEKTLNKTTKTFLSENLTKADTVTGIEAQGRDLHLSGNFQDAKGLVDGLSGEKGVRNVVIKALNLAEHEADEKVQAASAELSSSTEATNVLVNDAIKVSDATDSAETKKDANSDVDDDTNGDTIAGDSANQNSAEQKQATLVPSSLQLRYDGTALSLSGHMVDAQMAELIEAEVRRAIPSDSTLSASIEADGMRSPLNWMNRFLDVVAGLPGDAQGLIEGSDDGVNITPDKKQTLIQVDAAHNAEDVVNDIADNGIGMAMRNAGTKIKAGVRNNAGESLKAGMAAASPEANVTTGVGSNAQIVLKEQASAEIEAKATIEADASMNTEAQSSNNIFGNVAVGGSVDSQTGKVQAGEVQLGSSAIEKSKTDQASAGLSAQVGTRDGVVSESALMPEATDRESQTKQINVDPAAFIVAFNEKMAAQDVFASGRFEIDENLAGMLNSLVDMLHANPNLLLRIVGNIDFSVNPRDAEYVGIDRARAVRDYVRGQNIAPYRVFAAPLPNNYAFDKRVQIVFYISE